MRPEHPLADVERSLAVPPRRRLDVLQEVDADAEALQAELERRGYGPAQARRAALRRVVPGTETLAQLEAQHAPPLGRWVRGAGWIDRVERLGIVVATGLAGAVACITILGASSARLRGRAGLAPGHRRRPSRRELDPGRQASLDRRRPAARNCGAGCGSGRSGSSSSRSPSGRWAPPARSTAPSERWKAEQFAPPAMWDAVGRIVSHAALGLSAAIFGLFGWLAITPRLIDDETMEHRISAFFASRLSPTSSTRR